MKKRSVFILAAVALGLVLSACEASVPNAEKEVKSFDTGNISVIRVFDNMQNVRIVPSENNEITVTDYKSSKKTYMLEAVEGVLTVKGRKAASVITYNQDLTIAVPGSFSGELYVELDGGSCEIDIDADLSMVKVGVGTGDILVDALSADQMFFTVDTGSISGTLVGNESDYSILARCDVGTCSLSGNVGTVSGKNLNAEVDTGSINLRFINGNSR